MADTLEQKRKLAKQQIIKNHIIESSIEENDVDVAPEVSMPESFVRGAAQGASLGYADEFTSALGAGIEKLKGSDKDLADLYRQERDESRAAYKAAEEANPKTYLGGNIVGGIAPVVATGGLGATVKGAAALGAAAGLGSSSEDLTDESKPLDERLTSAGVDTALGATLGGGIASIPVIGKATGNYLARTAPGKAFLRGMSGEVINPSTFAEEVGKRTVDFSKNTLGKLQGLEETLARLKGTLLKENKTPVDLSKARETIEQGLEEVAPQGSNVASLNEIKNQALQDVSEAFGDKTAETLQKVKVSGVSTEAVPASASARQGLEAEIAKEKVAADALGQNIRHEIKESIGPDGKPYLTKITSSDEPIEAAERVVSVEDAFGNKESKLIKPDTQYKTTAKTKVVENVPEIPAHKIFSPTETEETVKILTKMKNNQPVTPQEAEQLRTVLESLKGKAAYKDIKPLTGALTKGQQEITSSLNQIDDIANVNQKIQDINAARTTVGAQSNYGTNAIDFPGQDPRQYKLSDAIYKAGGEGSSGAKTNDQLLQMIENLRKVDPKMAKDLETKLPRMLEDAEISGAMNPDPNYSRAGLIKQALTKGANPAGRYIGAPLKAAGDVLGDIGAGQATRDAGITAATRGGFSESDIDKADTTKLKEKFSQMSSDQLLNVASRLRNKGGLEGVATKIEKAANSGSPIDKAQAELVIQQNPAAKQALEYPNE